MLSAVHVLQYKNVILQMFNYIHIFPLSCVRITYLQIWIELKGERQRIKKLILNFISQVQYQKKKTKKWDDEQLKKY